MYVDKHQLIKFISSRYGDDDYFELTFSETAPKDNGALTGTTFGSADHMIRSQTYRETHDIHIVATLVYKG
jgi:hypothetical protein